MAVETDPIKPLRPAHKSFARLAGSLGFLFLLVFLIWNAGRAGFANLLATYASRANELAAANAAVSLSPRDPDAHYIRGAMLEANDDFPAALAEYTEAVMLRPDDYVLWLGLAHAREINGNTEGAVDAASRAVELAPYYAQPRWQLGNILVRAGRRDEGFSQLRLAAAADSTLLPATIDLAWRVSGGDVQFVKHAIQPQTSESRAALGNYFKKHGEVSEAIVLLGAASDDVEGARARDQYVNELISAKRFKEAYALWATGHGMNTGEALGVIRDSGFEQESNLDEPGFGWHSQNKSPSLLLSLDGANPREGKLSLLVEFKGDSDPATAVISQLVLVEPHTHYELHFATRTEKIVTGGPPNLLVIEASSNSVLGQSGAFAADAPDWRDYTIDFTTADSTSTIRVALQREPCSKSPCPIFGELWLDAFALRKL